LIINGAFSNPVILRGDRLDNIKFSTPAPYNNIAGQWGGIYLLGNSAHHIINNANINSAYVGFYVQNEDRTHLSTLEINNCRIHNFVHYGLVVQNGNVEVKNTEISNTGSYTVYLSGGRHRFLHTTIANYYSRNSLSPSERDDAPAVLIMGLDKVAAMTTEFRNCIIAGSAETEFSIADKHLDDYNGVFQNSYIMRKNPFETAQFVDIVWGNQQDTIFKNATYDIKKNRYFDFALDSLSSARGIADPALSAQIPLDLNGRNRLTDGAPDAGAYEWLPEE
jgi:hypothetical protein